MIGSKIGSMIGRTMPTAAYYTLGCKVNQYETEKIREALERQGFQTVRFGTPADVCVINTCTVTSTADSKSRAAVRKAVRSSPKAMVVVAGCYADLEPQDFHAIDGVDVVVCNKDKDSIPQRVISRFGSQADDSPDRDSGVQDVRARTRTRAVVKVQDGCDHFCSYCIIPFARSPMVSRPLDDVIGELESLAEGGYIEVVLTGIRLGSYKHGGARLPELIRSAASVDGIQRIRLSSIEPWEVDDELVDAMAAPKVCRHLHIPLQSGDDGVLRAMNRPYDSRTYADLIDGVRSRVPGIGVTTDVIVGFPGETDDAFENTCGLVRRVGFSRLHVFRYSVRRRTAAASMPDQVDEKTKKARSERLIELGLEGMRGFAESFTGQNLEVLVESRNSENGMLVGFTDNYIETVFPGPSSLRGRVAEVRIQKALTDGRAQGVLE